MKTAILGLVCLLLILSCDFEMPESITFKGSPTLYVPLGSPFPKDEESLVDLISKENVKKMLSDPIAQAGVENELTIYEVAPQLVNILPVDPKLESKVQTYLARYHLAEMPLKLEEYTKKAMDTVNKQEQFKIPAIPSSPYVKYPIFLTEKGPKNDGDVGYDEPFIKIPLANMAKLVKSVERSENGVFGLEIGYSADLAKNLELKIPGLGFDWMTGIPTGDDGKPNNTNPTKLRYYSADKKMFYPQAEYEDESIIPDLEVGNLSIYAKITAPFSTATTSTPNLIFDWENAVIDTMPAGEEALGSLMKKYPINNNLGEFLGKDVTFKKIYGYLYMSGVNGVNVGKSSMSIELLDSDVTFKEKEDLVDVAVPDFPLDGGEFGMRYGDILLKPNMMSLPKPIELQDILRARKATLQVGIFIKEMRIKNGDDGLDQALQFDLIILIPLDLKVSNQAPAGIVTTDKESINIQDYVMLDLKDALKNISKDGDLLGRKEGEDNALKDIESVKIGLKYSKSDINIIDPTTLAVLVTNDKLSNNKNRLVSFSERDASVMLDNVFLTNPFIPKFTVLLKKDAGKDYGSFQILRPEKPSFDFKLDVEAKVAFEYKLNL